LRVTGIQHPAPHLICSVWCIAADITMTASYATTLATASERENSRNAGDRPKRIYVQLLARYLRLDQQMLIGSLGDAGIEILCDTRPVFVDSEPRLTGEKGGENEKSPDVDRSTVGSRSSR
jgi:hypothetical protein